MTRYTNGRTSTGEALELVRTKLIFNAKAGSRENTTKKIIVITDGRSNFGIDPVIPARKLKENAAIFTLGVTNKINLTELRAIASSPSNVLNLKDFATLKKLTQSLQEGMQHVILMFYWIN